MSRQKIDWNSLLNLAELDLDPDYLRSLRLSDEIGFSLSLLTAKTRHDRKFLACDENGVLLVGNSWDGLVSVQTDELFVDAGAADSFTITVENKGVLLATQGYIVEATFVRVSSGSTETIYIAPNTMFWYPGSVYSVAVDDVPTDSGVSFYVGLTVFN